MKSKTVHISSLSISPNLGTVSHLSFQVYRVKNAEFIHQSPITSTTSHTYSQIHTNLTSHGQTRLAPWLPAGHASCCGKARQSRHFSPPAKVEIKIHTHTHRLLAPKCGTSNQHLKVKESDVSRCYSTAISYLF